MLGGGGLRRAGVREALAERMRGEIARQSAELERVRAALAVLQRMVFGRSSEKSRPDPQAGGGDAGDGGQPAGRGAGTGRKRGRLPGAEPSLGGGAAAG